MIRCMACMEEYQEGISKCPFCQHIEDSNSDNCNLSPRSILKGRYTIGICLGSGGFGITYVAWDSLLERKVAIKEYLPSEIATRVLGTARITAHSETASEKFKRGMDSFLAESQKLMKFVGEEGIVSVYDCFKENGTAYIVMEYLDGETLQDKIEKSKKLKYDEVLPIIISVLKALDIVHCDGIIHRDIAPDNIFICNDSRVVLIDFGAARYVTTEHSRSLATILKLGYAPPEQYSTNGNQGAWTDVYATAATLYHAVTGRIPQQSFDREDGDVLKDITTYARGIPANSAIAISNALNLKVQNRTKTAKEFCDALEGTAKVKKIKERIKVDRLKIPVLAKIASVVVAALLVGLIVLFATGTTENFSMGENGFMLPEGMTQVPSIMKKDIETAENTLAGNNLLLLIMGRTHDDYFDADLVLSQDPRPGNIVYNGSVVNVIISAPEQGEIVPNIVGYTVENATQTLEALGFTVYVREDYSDEFAPGTVISQNPASGEELSEGAVVTIVVSKGSEEDEVDPTIEAVVPNVVGLKINEAKSLAWNNKLYIVVNEYVYSDTVPEDEIISQTPSSGHVGNQGDRIFVVVSLGEETTTVPDVKYLSEASAISSIESRNLTVSVVYEESQTVAPGLVIRQSVAAGSKVKPGSTVIIYVSSGYKVTVPDVVGATQTDAQNILFAARLSCTVTTETSSTVKKGYVIRQSITSGTKVDQGTAVNIVVSAGEKTVAVEGISLNAEYIEGLHIGGSTTLIATIRPKNASNTAVTWSSSNPSVATVDSNGIVHAKYFGSTTITVTTVDGHFSSTCRIYVEEQLTSISITKLPSKTTYYIGDTVSYAGLKVRGLTDGNNTIDLTSKCTISSIDTSQEGVYEVFVSCSIDGINWNDSFTVSVISPKISFDNHSIVTTAPSPGNTGNDLILYYTAEIPSGGNVSYSLVGSDTSIAYVGGGVSKDYGNQRYYCNVRVYAAGTVDLVAQINYNGKTYSDRCTISIESVTPKSISGINSPKTDSYVGEPFNWYGTKIWVTYSDDSICSFSLDSSGQSTSNPMMGSFQVGTVDTSSPGDKNVSISYSYKGYTISTSTKVRIYSRVSYSPSVITVEKGEPYSVNINISEMVREASFSSMSGIYDNINCEANGNVVRLDFTVKSNTNVSTSKLGLLLRIVDSNQNVSEVRITITINIIDKPTTTSTTTSTSSTTSTSTTSSTTTSTATNVTTSTTASNMDGADKQSEMSTTFPSVEDNRNITG